MELPNALSARRNPAQPVDAHLHLAIDGETMRLSLRLGEAEKHEAAFTYHSPVTDDDAGDTRWLLEDYPRLAGRSVEPIASRIEERLHALAAELRTAVFESAEEAQPIRDSLANPELVNQLHISIEESQSSPWTPWELMPAPDSSEPLSLLASSFTRISTSATAAQLPSKSDKLRVLLITSRPSGEDDVPFRSVASRIVQAVAASPETVIQVDLLRPPTYESLLETLAAASETEAPYNVVHFDGHGSYEADVLDEDSKRGYLYFETTDGSTEAISGSILGADLAQYNVSYLLLNACRSAYTEANSAASKTTERTFGTLATEVRKQGVAGVLAMGFNLYVVTAARLVANTYVALAAGYNLSEAVGHARRDLYHTENDVAGAFDWLVPITFSGEAVGEREQPDIIPNLTVQASTTTPTSAAVIDPGAGQGSRSDKRPFFGYDNVLLRLDRACGASRIAELVGLSGVGKSAVAGEFARWWAATTPDAAIVLDVDSFGLFNDFNEQFQKCLAQAQAQTSSGVRLVVLEGANNILDGENERWSADDRSSLQHWIEQQSTSSVALLMTGRTPSGLSDVETIVLEGLDQESRAELATLAGFDRKSARQFPGLLPWSQGVPAVVLQLPFIVDSLPAHDGATARKILSDLRSGKTLLAGPQLGMGLIQRSGLEFFNVSKLRRAVLPFVLHLFQSYIGDEQWKLFYQFTTMKGLKLSVDGDAETMLAEELRPAVRAGLASRTSHGYLLHPLAPIALDPGLAATMQVLTRGNPDVTREVMGAAWGSYIQSVSVTIRMAERFPSPGPFGSLRLQRENLTNALEISVLGAWWGLALPLVHKLRDALLSESRDDEWKEILNEILVRIQESQPQENEMGPESAMLQIIRLLAEEAEHEGNEELLKTLRDLQLQFSYAEDTTIELPDGKEFDVGRIRKISSLLKRGDVAASEDSPDCLVFYNEALRLAEEEPKDLIRIGEVQYAIARAYLNVTGLRDPVKYEFHARETIKTALALGPLGSNLYVRASVSLGTAIIEEQYRVEHPNPERLEEAREALMLGVTAESVGEITRGTAHNGLGNLARLENDLQTALEEYLSACKDFEAVGDIRSLRVSQANAISVLSKLGKTEDALNIAREAGLTEAP